MPSTQQHIRLLVLLVQDKISATLEVVIINVIVIVVNAIVIEEVVAVLLLLRILLRSFLVDPAKIVAKIG